MQAIIGHCGIHQSWILSWYQKSRPDAPHSSNLIFSLWNFFVCILGQFESQNKISEDLKIHVFLWSRGAPIVLDHHHQWLETSSPPRLPSTTSCHQRTTTAPPVSLLEAFLSLLGFFCDIGSKQRRSSINHILK